MNDKFVCQDCGMELPGADTPHSWDDCVAHLRTLPAAIAAKDAEIKRLKKIIMRRPPEPD